MRILQSAPADPWSRGPINEYGRYTLAEKLQILIPAYLSQVSSGTNPERAAENLNMTKDDQEFAHIAHFLMPEALDRVINGPPERLRSAFGKVRLGASSSKVNPIPSPTGMDDGILTQATIEKVVRIAFELEKLVQDEERKLGPLKEREAGLCEAFRCFEEGHRLDPTNCELLYWLAESYRLGEGVPEDETKSVELFQRAAEMGHARSQTAMGDAYAQRGCSCLPLDEEKAARWYEAAAEQGNEDGLIMIVAYYQGGIGVKQDHIAAARLLCQAAARGNEDAKHNLKVYFKKFGAPYGDNDSASQ
jgi:hypothetical protein